MAHKEKSNRTKVILRVAAVSLALTQLFCGAGQKKLDPCDEAFQALTNAFTNTRPGAVGKDVVNVWPANRDGSASHPRVDWRAKSDISWRAVASFMRFDCGEQYKVISLSADQEERFYDDGVIIRKKPAQSFSMPELDLNWGKALLVGSAALFGIGALGMGVKKKPAFAST